MARAPRDYKAEYAQRIERSRARGLTRSQGRGHPRAGEQRISALTMAPAPVYNRHLEEGLKAIRKGQPLTATARSLHVAPERLRHYLIQTEVVHEAAWPMGRCQRPAPPPRPGLQRRPRV